MASHQRRWPAHLGQYRFGWNPAIHQPHAPRLPVKTLDLFQKSTQRGLVRRVAIHHFVSQRESFRRDHQRDHHLLAVRPAIPAITPSGFGILFRFAFHIRARQVVQQYVKLRAEQILSALP